MPDFTAECIGIHLAKVYEQEVRRDGPPELIAWWKDVDGCGTPIDDYMKDTVAPAVLVNGLIDVCLDHPRVPAGEKVVTRADELRLGLDKVVASLILPQNMVWWRKDAANRYLECLVREYMDPSDRVDVDEDGDKIDRMTPVTLGLTGAKAMSPGGIGRPPTGRSIPMPATR